MTPISGDGPRWYVRAQIESAAACGIGSERSRDIEARRMTYGSGSTGGSGWNEHVGNFLTGMGGGTSGPSGPAGDVSDGAYVAGVIG